MTNETGDMLLHEYAERDEVDVAHIPVEECHRLELAYRESTEIKEYLAKPTTIETLRQALLTVGTECDRLGIAGEQRGKIVEQAEGLFRWIEDGCHTYAHLVRRFEQMRRVQRFRMEPRQYAEALEHIDRDRRIIHNGLLENFAIFNRNFGIRFRDQFGIVIPDRLLVSESLVRSGQGNRQLSEEWALETDFYLRAQHLIEDIKKQGAEPEGPTPAATS